MEIKKAKKRLEEIRKEIKKEQISYGEIVELQSLIEYIDKNDVELLEWAGVTEFTKESKEVITNYHIFTNKIKNKMTNPKDLLPLAKLESKVLDLIYNPEDLQKLTTSDLQGVIEAIVLEAYQLGHTRGGLDWLSINK